MCVASKKKGSEKLSKPKNAFNQKRQDVKELIGILDKIPEERKGEVLGIVKGFALCAENEADKKVDGKEQGAEKEVS